MYSVVTHVQYNLEVVYWKTGGYLRSYPTKLQLREILAYTIYFVNTATKNYAVGILGTHRVNYVEKFRNMPNSNENLTKSKEKVPFIAISLSALANPQILDWGILFVCVDAIYVPVNNFSRIRTFPGSN